MKKLDSKLFQKQKKKPSKPVKDLYQLYRKSKENEFISRSKLFFN